MHPYIAEQLIADRQAQALAAAHHSRLVRAVAGDRPSRPRPQCRPGWRRRLWVGTMVLAAATIAFAGGPAESGSDRSTARRGTEAGILVGLRAVDSEPVYYAPGASRTWAPASSSLTRWLELYHEVTRRNGADADAGRSVRGAHRAGHQHRALGQERRRVIVATQAAGGCAILLAGAPALAQSRDYAGREIKEVEILETDDVARLRRRCVFEHHQSKVK